MNFEEWWNLSGANVIHKVPKDAARDAWNARVPEGYVLVPIEPTENMLNDVSDKSVAEYIYKAMIQAAQETE